MKAYAHYPYFLTVCKCKSFSAAAEQLGMAQSSISYQINRLEDLLETKLLVRTQGTKIQLTPNGQLLFNELLKTDRLLQDVVSHISPKMGNKRITISAPVDIGTYLLAPLINQMSNKIPTFELTLDDASHDLYHENVDLAIRRRSEKRCALEYLPLFSASNVLVTSRNFIQKYGQPNSLRELLTLPIIFRNAKSSQTWQYFLKDTACTFAQFTNLQCVSNTIAIAHAISAGNGIGIIPSYLMKEHNFIPIELNDAPTYAPVNYFDIVHVDTFLTRQWADQLKSTLYAAYHSDTNIDFI